MTSVCWAYAPSTGSASNHPAITDMSHGGIWNAVRGL